MMRVTEQSSNWATIAGLQANASKLQALQEQVSSGRQITKPSDDPQGTVTALALRSQLAQANQFQTNGTDAISWLTTVDSTYTGISSQLQQVRSLVLEGMNTGTNSAASNEALAQQVDQARSAVLASANATYQGRPVFGGTTAGDVAFDSSGTYVGDDGAVTRTVGPNTSIDINTPGTTAFGANGSNLFDVLSSISADLRNNPSALGTDLSALDTRMAAVTSDQALAGAKYARVQTVQTAASTNILQLKSQLSDVQDIDLADMAVEVTSANTAYQAALATTAKVSQTSLLDFLR